ncbi:endonuclease/exonuclease/phosphatase family protein [Niabella insulamsoli]|uniref:endonuclease/exonuclease/phosphatase family protein n=1 Tax=Niabella insulamsoli TaxID=3144874 RepID=UPI0031FDD859
MKCLCFYVSVIFFSLMAMPSSAQRSLKVMSYNIHHCNPPSKPDLIDVDAIAKAISKQQPDLVALQEVDVNTGRSGRIDEAVLLAQKTGMKAFYFAKAIDHDGGDYGVAILSKYPLSETQTFRLPMDSATKGERRVLAQAVVTLPNGQKIIFASTHLDAQKQPTNRLLQIEAINKISGGYKLPYIIGGDFNAEQHSEVIKILDKKFVRTCSDCKPTIPVINPRKAIDFLAFKRGGHFKVIHHEVVDESYASDHLPIVAQLELK